MKTKAAAVGHPIHPLLIPFPLAFLTGAGLFDVAGSFCDVPSWWTTGGHPSLAGIATALLAAIPGLIDYLYTVLPDSSGKARATKHMLANLTDTARGSRQRCRARSPIRPASPRAQSTPARAA